MFVYTSNKKLENINFLNKKTFTFSSIKKYKIHIYKFNSMHTENCK